MTASGSSKRPRIEATGAELPAHTSRSCARSTGTSLTRACSWGCARGSRHPAIGAGGASRRARDITGHPPHWGTSSWRLLPGATRSPRGWTDWALRSWTCAGWQTRWLHTSMPWTTADVDVVVTSGRTACGPVDYLRQGLALTFTSLVVDTVAARPGHPMLLSRCATPPGCAGYQQSTGRDRGSADPGRRSGGSPAQQATTGPGSNAG